MASYTFNTTALFGFHLAISCCQKAREIYTRPTFRKDASFSKAQTIHLFPRSIFFVTVHVVRRSVRTCPAPGRQRWNARAWSKQFHWRHKRFQWNVAFLTSHTVYIVFHSKILSYKHLPQDSYHVFHSVPQTWKPNKAVVYTLPSRHKLYIIFM